MEEENSSNEENSSSSDEENSSSSDEDISSSSDEDNSGELQERLRRNDATVTSVTLDLGKGLKFDGIIDALQNNTVVESIHCNLHRRRIQNLDPLYNCIRTRNQLGVLKIHIVYWDIDINSFLEAACENASLHTLDIIGSFLYTPESLGRLRSHPNLRNISFTVPAVPQTFGFGPDMAHAEVMERAQLLGQIIETCPRMQHVSLECSFFTVDNWNPICKALYHVGPEITLELRKAFFDKEASALFRLFLHKCPNPVHLHLFLPSIDVCSADLFGPSIHSLSIHYCDAFVRESQMSDRPNNRCPAVAPFFADLMTSIMKCQHQSIRKIQFLGFCCPCHYPTIFDCVAKLQSLEKFRARFDRPGRRRAHVDFSTLKKQFLTALAKNANIQTCKLSVKGAKPVWTDTEMKTLQSVLHRNESIRAWLVSPDLIPLSVWPHVFQAFQKTNSAMFLTYQCLRGGLTGRLTLPNGSDDAEERKSKRLKV